MKNINILGIKLHERDAREALFLTYRFLNEGAVHIILYLTTTVLMETVRNEEEKAWLEAADLTLWGDTEILKAADITARRRYHEVQEKEYLKIFLKGIANVHRSILAVSDTPEHAELLKHEIRELQGGVTIAGAMAIREPQETQEDTINAINMIAPTVIIARMPFSIQRKWLEKCRPYLNTVIWLGLPENFDCVSGKKMTMSRMGKQILNFLFNRQVNKYKK
ncbi:MAG: WecB/TagA/CpsF family glycosyltransferase [Roseburia sp.]|nr:WecB/TagA/CpsF family glycosyltransferase [Ruminococcus sp.]MCM1153764.1 WecB/TagA/CpsF family glycosyltransferase [Roseburia sp.]MCM1241376.1 WecB/TagA/CpsF family glycosyltransferase [Roseburia sp.]